MGIKFDSPLSDWLWGQLLPYHSGSTKLKVNFLWNRNEMEEIELVPCLAAASWMLCSSESLHISIYVSLGWCILIFLRCQQMFRGFSVKNMGCKPTLCLLFCEVVYGTGIQSLIIALCAVLVLHHRNRIGYSTFIFRNHNFESFSILAWLPIFLQWIMLAHQAAFYIKLSTSI